MSYDFTDSTYCFRKLYEAVTDKGMYDKTTHGNTHVQAVGQIQAL